MAPWPSGTACCITWPRKRTRSTAAAKSIAPEQTSAVYSPRLWPAIATGRGPSWRRQARHTATPAASIAGCVFSVLPSSASGPCWQSLQRS